MGYELDYQGRITFDRPVRLARPDEDCLSGLARFFTPVFERAEGSATGRHVTGFQVDEMTAESNRASIWGEDLAAIQKFARCHQVTLTGQLRWQGDGCTANPADDCGHVVFDLHGEYHLVRDSDNDQAAEAHRRRSCTCYCTPAPNPTPEQPTVGPPGGHRRAAAVLAAAGLTVLDNTDTGTTGLRVRSGEDCPEHTLVVPVVNGLEERPPPLPQNHEQLAAWVRLMQTARNTLTAAGWGRLWETSTGGDFLPPEKGPGVCRRCVGRDAPDRP
ncbi:hypothetical protein ACFWNK_34020 [Streptomyces sp. NPDC058417]|uniref:hypothetical protein n=1 Tax=unclassified Streptomyces TaxID=2593676 RepID=UPI003651D385